jgi:patatin-like phospholipase/acyl hydrolase
VLACGHAFCLDCIRDLTEDDPLPHRLEVIECPIHQTAQKFSPRLLPDLSGCRILSLDGGGVKGLAQLVMLKHIEERCFKIPLIHLFDLVVGTSIGGQIALALNAGTEAGPLTVAMATERFRELMKSAFSRKSFAFPVVSWFMDKTKYKSSTLEKHLQDLFGADTKLYIPTQSGLPNIAVTTVVLEPYKAHIVTN